MFWWVPGPQHPHGMAQNLGDALNPWLYERITGHRPRPAQERTRRKLLAIGSIIQQARPGDVVWGSGLNGKVLAPDGSIRLPDRLEAIDFRAVRGPLTRDLLVQAGGHVPETYGDPALLTGRWVPSPAKRAGTVVLPHFSDHVQAVNEMPDGDGLTLLRIDAPVEELITAINQAERVVTTALHGIVVAEALNVPVTFFRLGEEEALFKYEDHFAGTNRSLPAPVNGIRAALEADVLPAFSWGKGQEEALMQSCPF